MGRYLIRRLGSAALTLWGLSTVVFFLLRLFPGGPFDEDLALRPEIKIILDQNYGTANSAFTSYLIFLKNLLHGQLGTSLYYTDETVGSVIRRGLRSTIVLNGAGLITALVLAFALAVIPHLWPSVKALTRSFAQVGLALPALFFAPLLLWILCFHYSVFPLRVNQTGLSFVLPIFLLAFRPACGLARVLDLRLTDGLQTKFAEVHRSSGMPESRLLLRWLLRWALPPTLQQLPHLIASLLSGSLLIEILFQSEGLGFYFTQSLLNRDWSLALGLVLFFGLLIVSFQVLADLALMILDPRVRVQ